MGVKPQSVSKQAIISAFKSKKKIWKTRITTAVLYVYLQKARLDIIAETIDLE